MRNLWLALALLLPAIALGGDEDFLRFYDAALRLHESLEYERALEQLSLARKQAATGDQVSMVNLAEGVVLADLNKRDEAMAAFKAGLLLSPDAKLPLKVSPRVAADVEALRAKVKQELAPLIAKREAERLKAEADAKAAAEAKALAEKQKAEADERAREAQRQDDDKRKAEADAKAKEAARLLAEADAKLKELARLEAERQKALEQERLKAAAAQRDAPTKVVILPQDTPPTIVEPPLLPAPTPSKAPMVMTLVFLVAGAAAAGVGGYFGAQSQTQVEAARGAMFQSEANASLQQAGQSATTANILFGVSGGLGLGALISGIVWGAQGGTEVKP